MYDVDNNRNGCEETKYTGNQLCVVLVFFLFGFEVDAEEKYS